MPKIHVTDIGGNALDIDASSGSALMISLRDEGAGVEAICGGECSCGTCHVYIAADWLPRLPPAGEDETDMLEAIGELVEVRNNSRLACQIPVTEELDGLELEIGPTA